MEFVIYCKRRNSNEKFGPMDLSTGQYPVEVMYATTFQDVNTAAAQADKLAKRCPGYLFQVRKPRRSQAEYIPKECCP